MTDKDNEKTRIDEYIKSVVDSAQPTTPRQRDAIRLIKESRKKQK